MRKNFRRTLGTVTFIAIFLLFNFHFSSCKERNFQSPLINNPNLAIQALDMIPAGSTLQLVCAGNLSCGDSSNTNNPTLGGPKIIMNVVITNPIQANAAFLIKIQDPKGNPIKFENLVIAKE